MRLLDLLFPPRADDLVLRELTPEGLLPTLAPVLVEYTNPATVALLPFHNPHVRSALHEAKYHGSNKAFKLLGEVLREYLADTDERAQKVCLVPIPLSQQRQKDRGYNQVTEILAHAGLDTAVDSTLLERTRDTPTQVSLHREKRRDNMRGAFATTGKADPTYLYIVIDDVVTTGATLQAAIDALRAAGAENITPLALAH